MLRVRKLVAGRASIGLVLVTGFAALSVEACAGDTVKKGKGDGGDSATGGADGKDTGGSSSMNGGTASGTGGSSSANGGSGSTPPTGGTGTTTGGKGAGNTGGKGGAMGGSATTGGTSAGKGGAATTGGSPPTAGTGGTGNNGGSDCNGGPCNMPPTGLLNPEYTTNWNPGILKDTQLNQPLGADGLPVRTMVCASPKPGDNLNTAISGCAEGQVVQLAAGTYSTSATITIKKGVVLRGAGSGTGGTIISKTGGGTAIQIGDQQDQACYKGSFGTGVALTANATKETSVVTVGSSASGFKAGDLAIIDQVDDSTVQEGDCDVFKRVDKRSVSERVEIASVDTAAGTLTLSSPLHWTFKSASPYLAQIARATGAVTRWAGIEDLAIKGGTNPDYLGKAAGGIEISNAAYSWVKNVSTDGTIGGTHVNLTGTFRVVVRDGYFHHSANYGFAEDCYGIVIRCGAADNLVENNVVRYMNKPLMMNVSGGGNVFGYNYVDNSWADPPAFQEINIDTHCSFPHMELMEGNWAPHMGAAITHGNSGYLTYFRNYSSSQFAPPAVANSTAKQTGNVTALSFNLGDLNMTVVGNVLGSSTATDLGTAPVSKTYICYDSDGPCILWFEKKGDIAETSIWLHGNYDTVNGKVMWAANNAVREIPASLYRSSKPGWWPAGVAWPWVGGDLTPMIGTLPAKTRAGTL
jgi:hypothetical protein